FPFKNVAGTSCENANWLGGRPVRAARTRTRRSSRWKYPTGRGRALLRRLQQFYHDQRELKLPQRQPISRRLLSSRMILILITFMRALSSAPFKKAGQCK